MQKAHMVEAAGASISGRCQKALSKEAAVTCVAGLYAEKPWIDGVQEAVKGILYGASVVQIG